MAKTLTLPIPQNFGCGYCQLTSADTTAWKGVYSVPVEGAELKCFSAVSDDNTAAVNLRLGVNIGGTLSGTTITGGTTYPVGIVNVPINSGAAASINAVDLLNVTNLPWAALDRNGKRVWPLKGGAILAIAALATMTSAKTLTAFATTEEY